MEKHELSRVRGEKGSCLALSGVSECLSAGIILRDGGDWRKICFPGFAWIKLKVQEETTEG